MGCNALEHDQIFFTNFMLYDYGALRHLCSNMRIVGTASALPDGQFIDIVSEATTI
jgi:hypothetical protein